MTYLPDVGSLDKLFNNDWRSLFYGVPAETREDKYYTLFRDRWRKFSSFLDTGEKQFLYHWPLFAIFLVGILIVIFIRKSLRKSGTIKSRDKQESEKRNVKRSVSEESRIISDVDNEKSENFVEEPRSNSRSNLDSATPKLVNRRESGILTEIALPTREINGINDFLINLINSIEPGSDGGDREITKEIHEDTENVEILDLQESKRRQIDNEHCQLFYVLTPWLELSKSSDFSLPITAQDYPFCVEKNDIQCEQKIDRSSSFEENEVNKNVLVTMELGEACRSKEPEVGETKEEKGSTLERTMSISIDSEKSSSICNADELLSEISDSEEIIVSTSPEDLNQNADFASSMPLRDDVIHVSDSSMKLLELNLSPIARKIDLHDSMNFVESKIRTNSKHRLRSLSHDNRVTAKYFDPRRGESVSPSSRNRNKQKFTQQSKIPTLSPLAYRTMQHYRESDGFASEASSQIRSALLRRLRDIWEQHPRDATSLTNRSKNSSLNSSIYYTPEVSRIPLPRRSVGHSNASNPSHSPRFDDRIDSLTDQTDQSREDYTESTNGPRWRENVSPILPHSSTPKSSPRPKPVNGRR